MSNQETTFLAIGDVHSHSDHVIQAMSSSTAIFGHVPNPVDKGCLVITLVTPSSAQIDRSNLIAANKLSTKHA